VQAWRTIRQLARERRREIVGAQTGLIGAEEIIEAALLNSGLTRLALPADDPLLYNSHAVLDREAGWIAYRDDLSPATTRFNLAHELAHWWLHDGSAHCSEAAMDPEAPPEPLPYGDAYISGYSPAQRREIEANVFAAELLLPSPLLRELFVSDSNPHTYKAITEATGLSETVVLTQMGEALLADAHLPDGIECRSGSYKPSNSYPETHPQPPEPYSLDDSQRAAAEIDSGPVLISAGPGTGKTSALVARALHLVERCVRSEHILALTFSNKAASEMRERISSANPSAARKMWIGTFHAFGLDILRRYGTRIGLPAAPTLLDPADAVSLLERNLAKLNLSELEYLHEPTFPFRSILAAISRAKDELVSPEKFAELAARMKDAASDEKEMTSALRTMEASGVYRAWQQILQDEGRLDFGDLIYRTVELFEKCPDVLADIRNQYRDILVDEYQDINRASAVLVKMIADEGRGLWAVGDLRQAIYRFRGASAANVREFERDYPNGRRLSLAVNYRSRPELVRLFSEAAGRIPSVTESNEWTTCREGSAHCVTFAEAINSDAQVDGIARAIRDNQSNGVKLGDHCILCRTNSQADNIAKQLEERGVPVLYLGDLFSRSEVKDMLGLLSLACENSRAGLARAARIPEYGMSDDDVACIIAQSTDLGELLLDVLGEADHDLSGRSNLCSHIKPIAFVGDAFAFFARYLFGEPEYLRRLLRKDDLPSRTACMALYQLLMTARCHSERVLTDEKNPQRAFLEHVRHLVSCGEDTRVRLPLVEGVDAVRILTVHAAKGLEFPVVFVPNLAQGLFPAKGRGALIKLPHGMESSGVEDEPNSDEYLFFVAISRAKDRLIMSWPASVRGKATSPSPLLKLVGWEPACDSLPLEEWRADGEVPIEATNDGRDQVSTQTHECGHTYTLSEVEQYMRCPRQYFYGRIRKLVGDQDDTAYSAFHQSLWNTIRRVRREGTAATLEEAAGWYDEEWESRGFAEHAHAELLNLRAKECLKSVIEQSHDLEEPLELTLRFPEGSIRVQPHHFAVSEDGGIAIEQWRVGRPSDSDHKKPKLALIRKAAKETRPDARSVEIRLRYLATGETKEIPEKTRYEPDRVAKYGRALAGIAAGEFPAEPESVDQCPRCPFYFICPG